MGGTSTTTSWLLRCRLRRRLGIQPGGSWYCWGTRWAGWLWRKCKHHGFLVMCSFHLTIGNNIVVSQDFLFSFFFFLNLNWYIYILLYKYIILCAFFLLSFCCARLVPITSSLGGARFRLFGCRWSVATTHAPVPAPSYPPVVKHGEIGQKKSRFWWDNHV